MDFSKLKEKAWELRDKAKKAGNDAIVFSAGKLGESSFTIKEKQKLEDFIAATENVTKTLESGEEKEFTRRGILLFADTKSEFFKKALVYFPVLWTKAYSQNIALSLVSHDIENVRLEDYGVDMIPSLVVYENTQRLKVISSPEEIQKLVKSMSLDINKSIDEL